MGYAKKNKRLPITERIAKQGLYLPSGMSLKKSDIDYIVNKLRKIVAPFY